MHRQTDARTALRARLDARRSELERAIKARVYGIADPTETADPTYHEGLRASLIAALEYGLDRIEHGEEGASALPTVLLTQARTAAGNRIGLDTVLRRYFAGYSLLNESIVEEAKEVGFNDTGVRGLLRSQAVAFDRLLAAVSEEYERETSNRCGSAAEYRAERIERLLAGEQIETARFKYDFTAHHLGVIVTGREAPEVIRALARDFDRRLLMVDRGDGSVWAWLGGRRLDPIEMNPTVIDSCSAEVAVAIGEPGRGLDGWRTTHRQAAATLPIAQRLSERYACYVDVALLASVRNDELAASLLRERYLLPLMQERGGGRRLHDTLRAFLVAGHNVSSTSAALGVTRQTVSNRLRAAERLIGRPVNTCVAEIEVAMRLERLGVG